MGPLSLIGPIALLPNFFPGLAVPVCALTLFGAASCDGEANPQLHAVFKLVPPPEGEQKHMCRITIKSPTAVSGILALESNRNGDPKAWMTIMQNSEPVDLVADRAFELKCTQFMVDNEYYRVTLSPENQELLYSNIYVKRSNDFSAVNWEEIQANERKHSYIGIGIIIIVLAITMVVCIYICRIFASVK